MNSVHQSGDGRKLHPLGGVIVVVALVSVIIFYPPPGSGFKPFFGLGNLFLGLFGPLISQVLAICGGVLISRELVDPQDKRPKRLLVRITVSAGAVIVISSYVVIIGGLAPLSPIVSGPVIVAIVVGISDELSS